MTRKDEFFELKKEYESIQPPAELLERMQASMDEARSAAHRRKVVSIVRNTAIATAAAVAVFVLPNSDSKVATAMGNIPLIGGLIRVVTVRDYEVEDEKTDIEVKIPRVEVAEVGSPEDKEDPKEAGGAASSPQEETETEEAGKESPETGTEAEDTKGIEEAAGQVNDASEKFLDTLMAEYKKDAEDGGYVSMKSDYRVVTDNDNWFTLGVFVDLAAADGNVLERYYHIDKNTGNVATLKDVFKDGSDYITAINRQIEHKIAGDPSKYFSKAEAMEYGDKSYFNSVADNTNFYFDVKGNLVIVFDEGEIAPASTGIVRFTITGDTIKDMFKYSKGRERQGSTSGEESTNTGSAVSDTSVDTSSAVTTPPAVAEDTDAQSQEAAQETSSSSSSSKQKEETKPVRKQEEKSEEEVKIVVEKAEEEETVEITGSISGEAVDRQPAVEEVVDSGSVIDEDQIIPRRPEGVTSGSSADVSTEGSVEMP